MTTKQENKKHWDSDDEDDRTSPEETTSVKRSPLKSPKETRQTERKRGKSKTSRSSQPTKRSSNPAPRTQAKSSVSKEGKIRRGSTFVDTDPRTVGYTYGLRCQNVKNWARQIQDKYGANVFIQHYIPKHSRFGIWKILSTSEEARKDTATWIRKMEAEAVSKIRDGTLISTGKGYRISLQFCSPIFCL